MLIMVCPKLSGGMGGSQFGLASIVKAASALVRLKSLPMSCDQVSFCMWKLTQYMPPGARFHASLTKNEPEKPPLASAVTPPAGSGTELPAKLIEVIVALGGRLIPV